MPGATRQLRVEVAARLVSRRPLTSHPTKLVATPGFGADRAWFGLALNAAATFNVFRRLEVTNNGLFDILFESAPERSNLIGVWVFCTHLNSLPQFMRWQRFSDESR